MLSSESLGQSFSSDTVFADGILIFAMKNVPSWAAMWLGGG